MGSRIRKVALVATAALAVVASGCVPPTPSPPLRVTTTAETFDGVCDAEDCSFADAIAASNARPRHPQNLPNEIRVPAGTYSFTGANALAITMPVVINGASRATTNLDLTNSPITAPGGVLDPQAAVVLTGVNVISNTEAPTHVLASCAGHLAQGFSLMNSKTSGLAAVSTACDAIFVGVDVVGAASVITPNTVSAVGSSLPFPDEPLVVRSFSFVNSVVTGPSDSDGSSVDSVLTIQPPTGINISGNINGTHFDRVGLSLGDPSGGAVSVLAGSSSFDLAGQAGALGIDVLPGSYLRLTHTSVYGGGASGAVRAGGTLALHGATIANDGPAVTVGEGADVSARRSILTATDGGPVCSAPITLITYNMLVGTTCGTPSATDVVLGSHAELELGEVASNNSKTPTFSMMPAVTSPAVDSIPRESATSIDCPFNTVQKSGTTLDQRGFFRPNGAACDVGAVEFTHPPVVAPTTTTTEAPEAP